MTSIHNTSVNTSVAGASPPAMVKVWDPFIRVFHWSLVTLFIITYATGDKLEGVHIAAGYVIAGLIVLRVIWGFAGPPLARFSDFVRPPHEILAYLRDSALLKAPRYLGHSPAGGAMILALLAMLAGTCVTGHLLTTDAYQDSKWLEHVHEFMANLTVILIVLHVLGVLVASFEHHENLIRAMITGRKRAE